MNSPRIPTSIIWIWNHTASVIALALIVLAFVIGLRLGNTNVTSGVYTPKNASNASDSASSDSQLYTCSMHPSVRLTDPNAKCPICFMDLIPVRKSDARDQDSLILSKSETVAAQVETTLVDRFAPTSTLRLFGKVRTDETTVERISAYFPGRIEKLYANFTGARVNAGDHLTQMYSPELLAAFEDLHQAATSAQASQSMSDVVHQSSLETLQASRDRLRLFGIDPTLITRIEQNGYNDDTFTIDAPRGGTITNISTRQGEYIQTGQPIITIADLTHLWVDLQAFESQLSQIRWGQQVRFTVESHPGESFDGRVSFIDPMIDPQTRTAAVRIAVENPDRTLKPGMFASATISIKLGQSGTIAMNDLHGRWVCPMHPTVINDELGSCPICFMDLVPAELLIESNDQMSEQEDPLVVPASAVLFTGKRSIVYLQVEDQSGYRYTPIQVALGPRAGGMYIIQSGLSQGDRVVTKGAFRIDSSMQIAGKPSMMMNTQNTDTTVTVASPVHEFKNHLTDTARAYLGTQASLAHDDLDAFHTHATRLNQALDQVQTSSITGDDLSAWRAASRELRTTLPISDIAQARSQFQNMSNAIIALLERFGTPTDTPLFVAHCPMAFDFEGADWLQRTQEIDNPYFGASMLRCGEILRHLKPTTQHGAPTND